MNKKQLLDELKAQGITHPKVLEAIRQIPRQSFVSEEFQLHAYDNQALPIGEEQTISQPYIVALMTQAILDNAPKRVLEIGTGSGYQAAVLSCCVSSVYTIERIQSLYEEAKARFDALHLSNIHTFYGDGCQGLPAEAPFDAILVTARGTEVPAVLLDQLASPGVLIMPVGDAMRQELTRVTRKSNQDSYQSLGSVLFVPLGRGVI